MAKPILFITGGNAGLGYEALKAILQTSQPYEILLGSRSLSKGEAAVKSLKEEVPSTSSTLSAIEIDVESDESITKAYERIASQHGHLDRLINNAGANFDGEIQAGRLTIRQGFIKSWDVNVAGAHVVTHTFVPLLLKSSKPRVLFMASGTSSLANTTHFNNQAFAAINASPDAGWPKPPISNPTTCYRTSKTGLNMLAREWTRILKNDGVMVFAVSPGFLATGLAGIGEEKLKQMGAKDPVEGANFIRDVVEGKRDKDAGQIILAGDVIQPW